MDRVEGDHTGQGGILYREFDLSGKVAIVTGAGRGLGYHISLALAGHGADLVVCSRTSADLENVARAVRDAGRKVLVQKVDVCSKAEIDAMVEESVSEFGRIDILINNAGVNIPQRAVEVTEEAWDVIIDTNLKGLFFCAQAVGKVMIRQRAGKIINLSSQSGSVGIPQRSVYCASKGGVNLLTKVLAIEWGQYNINVNAIAPTYVETPMTRPMLADKTFYDFVMGKIVLGRVGQPEDVVGAVIYLASEASKMVTGHILLIDGGWTAH